jgi:hypothetical protein
MRRRSLRVVTVLLQYFYPPALSRHMLMSCAMMARPGPKVSLFSMIGEAGGGLDLV